MSKLLTASNLFCERDERVLFNDFSFAVAQGEIIHLKGPNGAGKTTLIRRLVGLSWVVEGHLQWSPAVSENGQLLDGHRFWYLAHRPAVTLVQTALENLRFAVALHNTSISENQLWDVLTEVGLRGFEDVPVGSLSAGQQRRVSLARLYLAMPNVRLWILDEPFTALDVTAVAQLETRIKQFAEMGGTVLMTSHHGLNHTAVRELAIGGQQ